MDSAVPSCPLGHTACGAQDEATVTASHVLLRSQLAVRYCDEDFVSYDIAGAKAGFSPSRHLDASEHLRPELELSPHDTCARGVWTAFDPEAVLCCGAARLGYGTRLVDASWLRARWIGSRSTRAIGASHL